MLKAAPNPIDVQDLQFKLHCKLSVFENSHVESFSKKCSLVASASQYGLLFIGTKTGFDVVRCVDLELNSVKDGDYHRREIKVDATVTHLSANCDGTLLGVVSQTASHQPIVQFYDVMSMLSNDVRIVNRLQLSPTPGTSICEVAWNPTNPEMFTACKSDGSLGVYEIRAEVNITELPMGACATCFCWSPKGKQIAVGSRDGKITQYKPADMKAARVISAPPILNCYITSLQWVSNFQFIGVYVSSQEDDTICQLVVVDAPKTGEMSFTNYEDVCFSSPPVRPIQFYLILQPQWNILMVSSSNSMEVAVLQQTGETWTQLTLMDSARAELPLSNDRSDTLPVGFALDTSSTRPLTWGEGTIPPMPRIFLLSHYGILCSFNVVNLRENVPTICGAPKEVGEIISSLFTTASSQNVSTNNSKPIQHHQEPTESASPAAKPNADMLNIFANVIPPAQGTSIFSFPDAESVPQNTPSFFNPQSNVQPITQDNRNTFSVLTSSNEEKSNSGSLQSILGNEVALGSDQLFNQESRTVFANTSASLENRGGIKLTFNNTLVPPQHPKPIFPNSQQSLNTGIVNQETAKLGMLGSQTSLEQSNSIQNIEKIIDNASTSVSVVPKPQAVFSQQVESNASIEPSEADFGADSKIGDDELNELLAHMIREECMALESELKTILHRAKMIDIAIGSDNEKVKLVQSTTMLEDFLNEVVNNNAVQKSDVHILKQNLFQTWAWLEEARSRHDTINDSTIVAILKAQPLDSAAEKQLHHIKHLVYYLESQLKQAHDALDDQWENFQNYCHKTCKMQLPTMETIFQTMLHQNSTFQKLTYQVKDISAKIKARDQLKLSSPSLVDLNSLKKIEHAMETLSMQPQDIFKLQYERIITKNKLMSPIKTQKLRNYLKQNDVKHIPSFKTSIPEPKLQALRESNSFVLDTDASKKQPQMRAIPDENTDHMKFVSASAISSTNLPVNAAEKLPQSSFFPKPLLFGSAFVPTSIFDASSSSAPLKSVPASPSEKTVLFNIPNMITPVTTASLFGLPNTTKSLISKNAPSTQIQDTVTSQIPSGLALQKGISYSIDQTKNLIFEYPNPVNPNAPVLVIEASNLPVTSTPKSYTFKMPTDEISITKVRSAPATKSIFNVPKDTEILKTNTPTVSLGHNIISPESPATASLSLTSGPSSPKPNFGDVSSTTITFKRGEQPVLSSDAANNIVNSAITKPVIVSKVMQPATSSTVSMSPVDSNLSQLSNVVNSAKSTATPISPSSKPTQNVFSENNITTKSTLPVTETIISQANASSFGPLFSTALENTKIQPISSTNIFGGSSAANTKSDAKTAGSLFSTDINTSSLIFGNTSGGKITQSQSTTQASSIFGSSKLPIVTTPVEATGSKAEENSNITKTIFGSVPQQISKMFGGGVPVMSTTSLNARKSSDENSAPVSTQTNIFAAATAAALLKSKDDEKPAISQTISFGTTTSTTLVSSRPGSVIATESSIFNTVQPSLTSNAIQGSIFAVSSPSTTGNIFGGSVNTVTTTSPSIFGGFGINPSTNMPPTSSIFATATTSSAPSTFEVSKATTPIFGSPLVTSTTTTEPIGITVPSVTSPLFGTTPSSSAFSSASTNTTNTTQSIFGVPIVSTAPSPFGAAAASTSSTVFGAPETTAIPAPFGSTVIASSAPLSFVTTGKSIFGNTSAFASTSSSAFTGQSQSGIFGAPANTSSSTSASNVFATQSSSFGPFGNATTTPSSQSFQSTSPFGNVFGGGSSPSTSSAPGTTMFGTAPLTSSNLFGAAAPTTNTSGFPSSVSNASFGFGGLNVGATTTSSQFGATSANPFAKSSSIFGGTPSTQSSIFGGVSQSAQSSSIFGTGTPSSQSSSIFGAGSAFGSSPSTQSAFGTAPSFGGTPAFGQQSAFGQSTFGNPQPGPFSGGSSNIAQTGFGTPSTTQKPGGFGSPPMFGSAPSFGSSPSFGGAPTFGSSPSFGSPGKIFGGPTPLGGFQAASTQENSTFANLASQNTVGFGNLAQQAQNSSSSAFSGNSSFSSWR